MKYKQKYKLREPYEKVGGMQKVIMDLQIRKRKPENAEERELMHQIEEAKKKGYMIHLPLE